MTAPRTREAARPRALYARILRLKHINPSGVLCFLFFEGSVALAIVLAFAELVDWLAVAVLPLSIALMVKVNDVIAGIPARGVQAGRGAVEAVARQRVRPAHNDTTETIDAAQRARQSAAYRYE